MIREFLHDTLWGALGFLFVMLLAVVAGCAQGIPAHPRPQAVFQCIVVVVVGAIVVYNFGAIGRALWLWARYHLRRRRLARSQLNQTTMSAAASPANSDSRTRMEQRGAAAGAPEEVPHGA